MTDQVVKEQFNKQAENFSNWSVISQFLLVNEFLKHRELTYQRKKLK